jgi:ATP phosphoribosyltransferase regulatory subunit
MPRWLLPESIADVLPSEARQIEDLRRKLLDIYRTYGYELLIPPLIEHLDSLLTGSGSDLGSRTFQLVDQLSGRTLGVRADMTPQVARIDAHLLNRQGVARFCYAGSVLHTLAPSGLAKRELFQVGGEIYGHSGLEADLEALELVVESIMAALVDKSTETITLDLCHYAIVPALLANDTFLTEHRDAVYALLVQKDIAGLKSLENANSNSAALKATIASLVGLAGCYGDVASVLAKARQVLPANEAIAKTLADLERLALSPLWARYPHVNLTLDLADLRGYGYHNGVGFAAYVGRFPSALARGGRYDDVGKSFGRARAATGFSLELRDLNQLRNDSSTNATNGCNGNTAIRAPWSDDQQLLAEISRLRRSGEIVVQVLPGHEHDPQEFLCDRQLQLVGARWQVQTI